MQLGGRKFVIVVQLSGRSHLHNLLQSGLGRVCGKSAVQIWRLLSNLQMVLRRLGCHDWLLSKVLRLVKSQRHEIRFRLGCLNLLLTVMRRIASL